MTVDEIIATIRASGGRITATKRALVTALAASSDHLTAEELTTVVQSLAPETSPSTVYRNLDELEALGVAVHSHLGRAAAVYHLAGPLHGHLLCEACGVTIEVSAGLFDTLARSVRTDYDFEVDRHHLALSGHCGPCRERAQLFVSR
jgi:Fur family transcriptional regulator, ferric uptake regulator